MCILLQSSYHVPYKIIAVNINSSIRQNCLFTAQCTIVQVLRLHVRPSLCPSLCL